MSKSASATRERPEARHREASPHARSEYVPRQVGGMSERVCEQCGEPFLATHERRVAAALRNVAKCRGWYERHREDKLAYQAAYFHAHSLEINYNWTRRYWSQKLERSRERAREAYL